MTLSHNLPMINLLIILFVSLTSYANSYYKIGIIDTGFKDKISVPMCGYGSKKFITNQTVVHAEVVASIIKDTLEKNKINYCLIDIQALSDRPQEIDQTFKAIKYVSDNLNLDYLNVSYGGFLRDEEECRIFEEIKNKGTKIFFAAGNHSINLDKTCNFFPACCSNTNVIVGNLDRYGNVAQSSNYGKRINVWRVGTNVMYNGVGHNGTSFSSPQALADYIVHNDSKTTGLQCR